MRHVVDFMGFAASNYHGPIQDDLSNHDKSPFSTIIIQTLQGFVSLWSRAMYRGDIQTGGHTVLTIASSFIIMNFKEAVSPD